MTETGGTVTILPDVDKEQAEGADDRDDDTEGELDVFAIGHG